MGFKAIHYSKVAENEVKETDVEGTKIRWLITEKDGADHFAMRLFEMAPKGHSPHHSHGWEHEVFILEGECLVVCGRTQKKVGPGYVVFVPPNETHHFENIGNGSLRFLCLVPHHS